MIITEVFTTGRICEFNTSVLCASDPFSNLRQGVYAIAEEFDLRLDLLNREHYLRLDIIRHQYEPGGKAGTVELPEYTNAQNKEHPKVPVTYRIPTSSIIIATAQELEDVSVIYITTGGQTKVAAWRQGSQNWLINGLQFESARRLYYTDPSTTSTNSAALRLFDYISHMNPELEKEQIADSIGYPYDAFAEIIESEKAQVGMSKEVEDIDNIEDEIETPSEPYDDELDEGFYDDFPIDDGEDN